MKPNKRKSENQNNSQAQRNYNNEREAFIWLFTSQDAQNQIQLISSQYINKEPSYG